MRVVRRGFPCCRRAADAVHPLHRQRYRNRGHFAFVTDNGGFVHRAFAPAAAVVRCVRCPAIGWVATKRFRLTHCVCRSRKPVALVLPVSTITRRLHLRQYLPATAHPRHLPARPDDEPASATAVSSFTHFVGRAQFQRLLRRLQSDFVRRRRSRPTRFSFSPDGRSHGAADQSHSY